MVSSAAIQAISSQFLRENAVEDGDKAFTKVYVDNIYRLSLIQYAGHLVTERDQVSQERPAFLKPLLAQLDSLVVLYMFLYFTEAVLTYGVG